MILVHYVNVLRFETKKVSGGDLKHVATVYTRYKKQFDVIQFSVTAV